MPETTYTEVRRLPWYRCSNLTYMVFHEHDTMIDILYIKHPNE